MPSIENILLWTLNPLLVSMVAIGDIAQRTKNVSDALPQPESNSSQATIALKIIEAMIFSALGTGLWVLAHWLLWGVLGKSFVLEAFLRGRGTWIDLLPYAYSVFVFLSIAMQRCFKKEAIVEKFIVLVRILGLALSVYILIVNYLYVWKCHV